MLSETITATMQVLAMVQGFNGIDPNGYANFSLLDTSEPMSISECLAGARENNIQYTDLVAGETIIITCAPYIEKTIAPMPGNTEENL